MTHPAPKRRPEGEPIQTEAIDRLRFLGQDTSGESILALVVAKFGHEAERWRAEIRAGLAVGDLAVVQRLAHTLRGSALILGASHLVGICGELETCADGGDAEGCEMQLRPLEEALSEALSTLSRMVQSSSSTTPSR